MGTGSCVCVCVCVCACSPGLDEVILVVTPFHISLLWRVSLSLCPHGIVFYWAVCQRLCDRHGYVKSHGFKNTHCKGNTLCFLLIFSCKSSKETPGCNDCGSQFTPRRILMGKRDSFAQPSTHTHTYINPLEGDTVAFTVFYESNLSPSTPRQLITSCRHVWEFPAVVPRRG